MSVVLTQAKNSPSNDWSRSASARYISVVEGSIIMCRRIAAPVYCALPGIGRAITEVRGPGTENANAGNDATSKRESDFGLRTSDLGPRTSDRDARPSALLQQQKRLRIGRADVIRSGTDQPIVRVLLEAVGGPARHAADGKDWREEVDWNAERVIRRGRVEVDVRIELLLSRDEMFDPLRHLVPAHVAGALTELPGHLPQVRRARIFRAIDAVTEAGDLHLPRKLSANGLVDPLGRRILADLDQQAHHVGIGAAVQGTLQRANRADGRRVQVGERCGGHARGKRGGVQFMIRVQHERDIERARGERVRSLAFQHVEKIRGVPERGIRLDQTATRLQPAVGRDESRYLRGEAHGLAIIRGLRVVSYLGIVLPER